MPWGFWLIFVVLVLVIPWRGYYRLQKLFARPQVGSSERMALYAWTVAFQWLATLMVAWRAWARGLSPQQLGLLSPGPRVWIVSGVGLLVVSSLHWLNLRRIGGLPAAGRGRVQKVAERILPRNAREFLVYAGLAVTAGICEEFLYRGFAMAVLAQAGLALWATVVLSSLFFGLAHVYQGRAGFVSTLLVGVVFALARTACHSLIPVMVWHSGVDLVAGAAGYRYLLRSRD
jgi:membrane protease YdiL (CAAX protease family)